MSFFPYKAISGSIDSIVDEASEKLLKELNQQANSSGNILESNVGDVTVIKEVVRDVAENSELKGMSVLLKKLFIRLNIFVGIFFLIAFFIDTLMVYNNIIASEDRIINSGAVLALIAATFSQVGAGFFLLIKYYMKIK